MDLWSVGALEGWAATILERSGLEADPACRVASVLMKTDLRGIRTHGLSRIPSYVQNLKSGISNARPNFRIEETAGTTIFDADRGLGQVAGQAAVTYAVDRARTRAFVPVVIRDVGHLGALGVLLLDAVRHGMMALLVQNGPPLMAPIGAARRAIGNNPLAFAAPIEDSAPLVFDMATSETAFGRILEAARAGEPIPGDWALDSVGNPTVDAQAALTGILLPSGGHKGIGIAMMIECLTGVLSGTYPTISSEGRSLPGAFGALLLVINPALLIGQEAFHTNMQLWLSRYKKAGKVFYPGERAAARELATTAKGLDITPALVADLIKIGKASGVPFPECL